MRYGIESVKDPAARKEELEKRLKQLIASCEKDRPQVRCNVSGYFRGGMYVLIENLEIRDVRLVYAPPRSIGNYGGEEDNWAWPRHTGDFSFLRAYVGKDGKPALHSNDNVPFHPKHHLKIATAGLKPGDFVMVTGYPGSTSRTKTASEIRHYVEWYLPYAIAHAKERYAMQALATGSETRSRTLCSKASRTARSAGHLDGLEERPLARKNTLDKQVKDWAAQPGNEASKAALERLEQIIADEQRTARVDYDRAVAIRGSSLLSTALGLTRWAEERAKKDADRKPGYQERDLQNATSRQKQFAKDSIARSIAPGFGSR
jgi:hypothetical protein